MKTTFDLTLYALFILFPMIAVLCWLGDATQGTTIMWFVLAVLFLLMVGWSKSRRKA